MHGKFDSLTPPSIKPSTGSREMREKISLHSPPPHIPPQPSSTPTALTAQSENPSQSLPKQTPVVPANAAVIVAADSPPSSGPPPSHSLRSFKDVTQVSQGLGTLEIVEGFPLQVSSVPYAEVQPLLCKEDDVFVPISEGRYLDLVKPWNDAIICKVVGRSFSQDFLKKELQKV